MYKFITLFLSLSLFADVFYWQIDSNSADVYSFVNNIVLDKDSKYEQSEKPHYYVFEETFNVVERSIYDELCLELDVEHLTFQNMLEFGIIGVWNVPLQ